MKRWHIVSIAAVGIVVVLGGAYITVSILAARTTIPPGAKAWVTEGDLMLPTIMSGERVLSYTIAESEIERGMPVVVRTPEDQILVMRIAALAGDRIELRHGVVIVNGRASAKRGTGTSRDSAGREVYTSIERFPGEAGAHRMAERAFDDMPEFSVGAGRIFLLGDDRDNHSDSRFMGKPYTIQVAPRTLHVRAILGRVTSIMASGDWSRTSAPLDLPASAIDK